MARIERTNEKYSRAREKRLHEAIAMAENRLEAALLGDEVCKGCVEVAQSYLQDALKDKR